MNTNIRSNRSQPKLEGQGRIIIASVEGFIRHKPVETEKKTGESDCRCVGLLLGEPRSVSSLPLRLNSDPSVKRVELQCE